MDKLLGYLSGGDDEHDLFDSTYKEWSCYDPIDDLKNRLVEPLDKSNYIAVCCNIMFVVEQDMSARDIDVCVAVLNSIDELKDLHHYHRHVVEKLYQLADNGKLEKYFKKKQRMCVIL